MVEERSRGCGRNPGSTSAILPARQTTVQRRAQPLDSAKEFSGCSPYIAHEADSNSIEECCRTSESVFRTADSAIRVLRWNGVEVGERCKRSKSCRREVRRQKQRVGKCPTYSLDEYTVLRGIPYMRAKNQSRNISLIDRILCAKKIPVGLSPRNPDAYGRIQPAPDRGLGCSRGD
jgi:hypothetical protein